MREMYGYSNACKEKATGRCSLLVRTYLLYPARPVSHVLLAEVHGRYQRGEGVPPPPHRKQKAASDQGLHCMLA